MRKKTLKIFTKNLKVATVEVYYIRLKDLNWITFTNVKKCQLNLKKRADSFIKTIETKSFFKSVPNSSQNMKRMQNVA